MLAREPAVALLRHNLLLARRDLGPLVIMVAMPLVLIAFLQPALRSALRDGGYPAATGAEQAVPGMTVLFVLFMVGVVGFRIFEEHGWGTWDRLRASPAGPVAIMVGKLLPTFLVIAAQLTVLFAAGVLLYGLVIAGSLAALALLGGVFALMVVSLGLLLASYARTVQQLNVLANIGAAGLAGIGGAFVPVTVLPPWAQVVAPVTPAYWAMRGFHTVILDGGALPDVLLPLGVLVAFTAGFAVLAAVRFRFDEAKG